MVSEGNLEGLREAGLPYLVATRLRRDKVVAQEVLSQPGRYQVVAENLRVKEVHLPGAEDRYIVCLNPLGAEEDRRNREAILAYLAEKLRTGNVRGLLRGVARRYVRMEGGEARVDRAKIEEDARYDGKWVLRTNCDLPPAEVARAYKGLWQVEQAFRTLKTPLELRPIYHWTETRIRERCGVPQGLRLFWGHVMVCFLAFVLRQILRKRLENAEFTGSFTEVLAGLARVRAVILAGKNGERFLLRDEIPAVSLPALRAVGVAAPQRLTRLD